MAEALETSQRSSGDGILRSRLTGWVFGDEVGIALFLGALVLFGLFWKVGSPMPGAEALASGLRAVANGTLALGTTATVEPGAGRYVHEGAVTTRNYGQFVLSLPVVTALWAGSTLIDPAVVLAGAWSAVLAAFAVTVGRLVNEPARAGRIGSIAAGALFLANALFGDPLGHSVVPLLSLQVTAALAAAFVAVIVYRLVARIQRRRVGLAAGASVVLATPVSVWASVPERHSLVALGAVLTVWAYHRSQAATAPPIALRFRALAYVPAGMTSWIHGLDGMVLLVTLAVVDGLTARSNGPQELLVVGVTAGVSLLPALVTNLLVTGHPLVPPESLVPYVEGATSDSPSNSMIQPGGLTLGILSWFVVRLGRGIITLADVGRVYEVFLRSGFATTQVVYQQVGPIHLKVSGEPFNLSILEAMPLLGALLGAPAALYRRRSQVRGWWPPGASAERGTDALVGVYLLLLVLVYFPTLPAANSITVRPLHPLFPLGVYLLVRLPSVRRVVHSEWEFLKQVYGWLLPLGGMLVFLANLLVADGPHQIAQYNVALMFASAAVLGYWSIVSELSGDYVRAGAYALAGAGALTTLFVVLSAYLYLPYTNEFALPVVREVADLLLAG